MKIKTDKIKQKKQTMTQKLFLGIDGGSTKMDFLLVDKNLKTVAKSQVKKGSNLKYVGAKTVIKNIQEGLKKLQNKLGKNEQKLQDIVFCFAGIAECGEKNPHEQRKIVTKFLESIFGKNFILDDDQLNVFRSLSTTKRGVLANAGTGSNINFFTEKGENKTVKSVSFGGRDFGKTILAMGAKDYFSKNGQIYNILREHLQTEPKTFYKNLNGQEFVITKKVTDIPKKLQQNLQKNPELKKEIEPIIAMMGIRWGAKISAYCLTSFGFEENEKFEIVLRGGLWRWKNMKKLAKEDILKTFPNAIILENSKIPAVLGSCKLAIENYNFRKNK